jgi:hypothetical protein
LDYIDEWKAMIENFVVWNNGIYMLQVWTLLMLQMAMSTTQVTTVWLPFQLEHSSIQETTCWP